MAEKAKRNSRPRSKKKESNHNFFVVGLGASAGGISALEKFFEQTPAASGMAFVVILHLSPEHESHLSGMLQRKTAMPVIQVSENVKVEPDHVYVIPPAKHLAIVDGTITVFDPDIEKGRRVPIDLFFRTLARAYQSNAVGVLLSGTGTDGTLGLRRIKEDGGISLAQDPEESEYDGMVLSAIENGVVDFVLPVAEIPAKILSARQIGEAIWRADGQFDNRKDAIALREVLALLRVRTRHDFTNYKQSTVLRRITRRMQVNSIVTLTEYLEFMRDQPSEVQLLLSDLLISVTNFFRDHEAFDELATKVIPKLFEGSEEGEEIRIWVVGCATGEEAYSLAMLVQEQAERLNRSQKIQIFASDIDEESIQQAREGVYPDSIETDVSPERLRRFFNREGQNYQIKREIRDLVLFASHNILRDPPFSKLDLVSCRNLLIYLNREAQERVLNMFHFALRPNGYLFLGASESADNLPQMFFPLDKKYRLFKRSSVTRLHNYLPTMPFSDRRETKYPGIDFPRPEQIISFIELHQALLEQYAPPSILVNESDDIIHLSENAGRYLRHAGGLPTRNILKVVHPDLRQELRGALLAARSSGSAVESRQITISLDGQTRYVNISVRSMLAPKSAVGYQLIIFDEVDQSPEGEGSQPPINPESGETDSVFRRLEEDLQHTKELLNVTIEQYETSNEELRSSNEMFQSMNEELRSTTEELETSKEELQSLNEELVTLNHELKDRIDEVSHANSDLQNLISSTDIGTIFLDRELRIKRYTPRMTDLFHILPADIGRPLAHLTNRLDYPDMSKDAHQVLQTLRRVDREIRSANGQWFVVHLVPYRTLEDKIDGVVFTFMDITKGKEEEARRRASDERLRTMLESIDDYAIFTIDRTGLISSWGTGAEKIFGYKAGEAIGQPADILFTLEDRASGLPDKEKEQALQRGRADSEHWLLRKDDSRFYASGVMTPLRENDPGSFVKILRDLTARKQVEENFQLEHKELERHIRQRARELEESYQALQIEVSERRVAEGHNKELLRRIVSGQELERQRISRDLHDMLGQPLTALRLNLESLKEHLGEQAELSDKISQAEEIAKKLDSEIDFLAWELRPAALEDLGLAAAIEGFVQDWSKHFNIATEFHTSGLNRVHLLKDAEINLYRIAQEALNNVAKHAEASRVAIILEFRDQDIVLVIEDYGKGFDPNEKRSFDEGMGLISMHERAALVGGTLEIESTLDVGTTVFARIPFNHHKSMESQG